MQHPLFTRPMFPRISSLKNTHTQASGSTQETASAAHDLPSAGGKRKASPQESARMGAPPGQVSDDATDLGALLLLRRAAGRPFESTPTVRRLKAAQQGMRTTAASTFGGTSNLLPDIERSEFRNVPVFFAQRAVASSLLQSVLSPSSDANVQALHDCWPAALLKDCEDLEFDKWWSLLSRLAGVAMARLGGVHNCAEKLLENIANSDVAAPAKPAEEGGDKYATARTPRFVFGGAGDHAWLELRDGGTTEGDRTEPPAHPDDLIIDSWASERGVPLFREDAVYPASARYTCRGSIPPGLAEKLPQYLDEFVKNLRVCPAAFELWEAKLSEMSPQIWPKKHIAANLRQLEQDGIPVAESNGLYPRAPHPLRPDVRAAARKGLAAFEGFSAAARHSDVVATRIARDLSMTVREATRQAPRMLEIAKEMAAEPLQRRMIAGRKEVFDDGKPRQGAQDIIASLDGLDNDTNALHTALWHLEDALLTADSQTLTGGVAALRNWWTQADVPLPIHAHVFDILANDRIGNSRDFTQIVEMAGKLPVFAQSEAMLSHAMLFLFDSLEERGPSVDDAAEFAANHRPRIERECAKFQDELSKECRREIKLVLDLASGVQDDT